MEYLIKSLEKNLLELDRESIKRKLTVKEKKQKEYLKYEIYWAKFKKFKADFERLILTDVEKLASSLKKPLLEKKIVIRTESHIKNSTRFFEPDLPFYMIVSISNKSNSLINRWEKSPFLLIKGNHENGTVELFDVNQDLTYVSSFIKKNVWDFPIEQFKIDEYKFTLFKPHIEKWLDRNVNRIHNSESYKKKYKIV
ncbi:MULTISPECIES: hypothetical protein [unclassified Sphingobacterium]|uniref:hypothetical protein n=1 Tax=unclassified Sphingobacterium TaxID=2609468 RepID=UPI001051D98A|nr:MULTISPECIES: hypothetical protein [unclassified Sphingobacterium]MCS3556617.1 hypothetical protein [Sphingobacterium sp. JUb21]TCQ99909.1 hypothetical protein EDF66_113134 [Sphingobacterium sp. JUb20]